MAIFDPGEDTSPLPADYADTAEYSDPIEQLNVWELNLTPRERVIHEAGFLAGYFLAEAEITRLRAQLAQAEADADRYYAEMCRRPAAPVPDVIPYAELCRRRGEHDRAARAEKTSRALHNA